MSGTPTGASPAGSDSADPSALTLDVMHRELAAYDHLTTVKLDGLKEIVETRLEGMDKAFVLFQENLIRVPTDTDKQIGTLRELVGEKFNSTEKAMTAIRESMALQFTNVQSAQKASEQAGSTAIAAALSALKEMIGLQNQSNAASIAKSEASTTEQLAALRRDITGGNATLGAEISNLKGRMDRGEATIVGTREARGDSQASSNTNWGIIGGVIGLMALMASIAFGVLNNTAKKSPEIVYQAPLAAPPAMVR